MFPRRCWTMPIWVPLVFIAGCSDDPPETACGPLISGEAPAVEFVIHNKALTPRFYPTKCDSPIRVLSPQFGYAPANAAVLLCDTAPTSCSFTSTCMDAGLMPFAPGTSQSFMWDGVVYMSLDAAQQGCPAAKAGPGCFSNCARKQDGDAGEYQLTIRVYEEDLSLTEFKTTFTYPQQTKVMVDVP